MDQIIYALLAMMLIALFSLNTQRGVHASEHQMIVNEVATQLTGVGVDVIEHISRTAFDENTDESKVTPQPPTYPIITNPSELTPEGSFGGCTSLALSYKPDTSCDDIDDFHGVETEVEVDGLVYTVGVIVQYVDPANPASSWSGTQTYAKEVTLTISNNHLLLGSEPLQVKLRRIFTYNRHTQLN